MDMEERLARLERQNRGLLILAALILIGAFTLGASSPTQSKPCILFDSNLLQRAVIGLSEDGEAPGIWMFDQNESKRLFLGLNADGQPMLIFYNENESVNIHWSTMTEPGGAETTGSKAGAKKKEPRIIWPADHKEFYVWDTRQAKKFHQWGCPHFNWSKYQKKVSAKQAKERGIQPCKECCKEYWEGLPD